MRRISRSVCLALGAIGAMLAASCAAPRRFQVQVTAAGSLVTLPGEPIVLHRSHVYSDRNYTFTEVTRFGGLRHVLTANDDKSIASRQYLELEAGAGTAVYLALDKRATAPRWLAEEGFTQTPPCDAAHHQIAISDSATRFALYCRPPRGRANRLTLGGNADQSVASTALLSMYLLFYQGELTAVEPGKIEPAAHSRATPASGPPFRQLPPSAANTLCAGGPLPGPAQLLQWSGSSPRQRADLRCAQLPRLDFSGQPLDLGDADLIAANFQSSNLSTAVLDQAEMMYANLADATLARTSLRRVNLSMADLSRAKLRGADLSGANLRGAKLDDADFTDAKLEGAVFEPLSLTTVRKIGLARGLDRLRFFSFPDALIELRDNFKQAGFRQQEREVTAALEREYEARAPWYGRWARRLLLRWTCDYGLAVARPLLLIAASLLLFPWLYALFARLPGSKLQLIDCDDAAPRDLPAGRRWPHYLRLSLASAFALGGEFGVGDWIDSLLPSTNSVRAQGPLRTLAGVQSLLTLLLLALWAFIFLGRPFE
jgi:hypothetical protein